MAFNLNSLVQAGGTPADMLLDKVDAGVQAWLNTTLTNAVGHQIIMTAASTTSFVQSMGFRAKTGVQALPTNVVNKMAQQLNSVVQQPNIEGIVIYASQTSVNRDVEVSSTPVIQQSISARKYVTDSATPMPREFTISGYLQTLAPEVDIMTSIRPTVVAQAKYLDSCAMSRCPVWYKDDYNRFFLVMITQFKETHLPEATNVLQVDISMQEYIPYIAEQVSGRTFMTDGMNTIFRKVANK